MNTSSSAIAENATLSSSENEGIPEERVPKVSMQKLLLDCYEFYGLRDLGILIIFFFFAAFYLFLQWGTSAATFKNAVIRSMKSYGTNQLDWQMYDFQNIDNLGDAVDFSTGYLQTLWYSTHLLNIPDVVAANGAVEVYGNRTLYVSDFAQISYARLLVNLDRNCVLKDNTIAYSVDDQDNVECWRRKCAELHNPLTCTDPDLAYFLQRWQRTPSGDFVLTAFATKPWQMFDYTTNSSVTLSTIADMNILMDDIDNGLSSGSLTDADANVTFQPGPVDRRVIYKYGSTFKLGLVGSDRLSKRKDAAMFTLTTTIRGHNKRLLTTSGTSTIFLQSPGALGALFDFFYVCFTLWFIRKEVARARLSSLQHRSLKEYLRKGWNVWQIMSHACNVIWLVSGWCIREVKEEIVLNDAQYRTLEIHADTYNIWLMCGIIVVLILGISLCRFMRIHVGLNAFYHVLADALREIADFLVFVAYIFLVLGSAIFAFFQICGGNSMFIDYGQGVLAMSRLMFGFLDFEEFHNYGMGLGTYYWTVTFLFWLSVVFLVLFTFNVLLAIFNLSYERVHKHTIKVEYNFVVLVVMRLAFTVQEVWYLYISLPVRVLLWDQHQHDEQLPSPSVATLQAHSYWHRLKDNFIVYRHSMHTHNMDMVAKSKRNSISFRLNLLFARWCISRMPEMQAIMALYTNFADLKMIPAREKPSWPWLASTSASATAHINSQGALDVTVDNNGAHVDNNEANAGQQGGPDSTLGSSASSPNPNPNRAMMQQQPPSLRRAKRSYNYGLLYEESVPTLKEAVTRKQLNNLLMYIHQERHLLGYQQDRWWMHLLIGSNPFDSLKRSSMDYLLDAIMSVYDTDFVPQPTRDVEDGEGVRGAGEDPQQVYQSMTQVAEVRRVVVKHKVDEVMRMLNELAAMQAVTSGGTHS